MTILEKAFAKFYGNYKHIEAGDIRKSAKTLSGAPYTLIMNSTKTVDELWTVLSDADQNDNIIQCGTEGTSDRENQDNGLVKGHAYTVLGVVTLNDADKTRIVKLRNPWGKDSYTGPWADGDERWNEGDNATVGDFSPNLYDGIIHMDIDTFKSSVAYVSINYDTTGWHQAYFM